MYKRLSIRPPFFEFGPKAYLYGDELLKLALTLDELAGRYDVDIIITPQYSDIRLLSAHTKRLLVFAQHMDFLPVGRGLGSVLPEALVCAGAKGVMLNHAERPLDMKVLERTITRADDVGLGTIVCADTLEETQAIARMGPNLIAAEPTGLIGTGSTASSNYVLGTIEAVHAINPDIMVLQGAGISSGRDVYDVIKLGAMATGSTSGIIKAEDPGRMAGEMIMALRCAWDELHSTK